MIKYQKVIKEVSVPTHITCDVCGKTYFMGTIEEVEIEENDTSMDECIADDFIRIQHECGYGSPFGDGEKFKLDICPECAYKMFSKYVKFE